MPKGKRFNKRGRVPRKFLCRAKADVSLVLVAVGGDVEGAKFV